MSASIRYGKANVTCYRTYAAPLAGIASIPESPFTGRPNLLFATDVDVEVIGDNFMPAYTEGDNSNVVATDTMKNFILRKGLEYNGATVEGFLLFLGQQFLATYPQMQQVRMAGREVAFQAPLVPGDDGTFAPSTTLFAPTHSDHASARLLLDRDGDGVAISDHQCGRQQMQLIKITGSAFAKFARDEYTTLPEVIDRPLFIYLDLFWRYADPSAAVDPSHAQYVPAEQVRDVAQTVFHQFVSMSIQHLVNEIGQRLLERFPQLVEVSFDAQNRTWETFVASEEDPTIRSCCDPRPPYGSIGLVLRRD